MNLAELEAIDERWVPASGPVPAELAYVAEAPGMHEVRATPKRPLVGPTGEINWQLSRRYGAIDRFGAYVTNWCKIPLTDEQKKKITPEEVGQWTQLLLRELVRVAPKLIVALGAWSTTALLGPGHALHWANGIPFKMTASWGETVVVPVTHPAAGLHESSMLDATAHGYAGVRAFREGRVEARAAGEWKPGPVTKRWEPEVDPVIVSDVNVAIDTEGSHAKPHCLTFSVKPHEAWIIYATEKEKLRRFVELLKRFRPRIVLHNSVHDAGVLRNMCGLEVWDFDVIDTMVEAFVLQDLPKGLKPLTMRLHQIHMDDYEDVVRPYQEKADAAWKDRAYLRALQDLSLQPVLTPGGKQKMSKGSPVMKWRGPVSPLGLKTHIERGQQLSPSEQGWAEREIGPRPGMDLKWVPLAEAEDYAGRDAGVTLQSEPILTQRIVREGLSQVSDLDHAVLPLIEDMQRVGMHLDIERYWEVLGDISTRRLAAIEALRELVSLEGFEGAEEFNPASSDQVAAFCNYIYARDGRLGLSKLTRGDKESTAHAELAKLRDEHPFIDLELDFRELDKYENTYLLPLQPLIRQVAYDEWRVFVNLRMTNVVSGRLSAHEPNVLAWPARTKLGLTIRSIFTAPPGWALASWDLSQIELRIAAALSGDPVMLEAFANNLDLHTNLAANLFQVSYLEADGGPDQKGPGRSLYRTPAKNIHYMLFYGGGGDKLFEMLRSAGNKLYSRQQCHELMARTKRVYSVAIRYLQAASQEAREKGYVTDFLGRRRFLSGCRLVGDRWPSLDLRLEAERQAGNFRFQGAAAETLKRAMLATWSEVYPKNAAALRLWLQIHDELMGQVRPERWAEINAIMTEVMTRDSWLVAPIKIETSGQMGAHWGQLK